MLIQLKGTHIYANVNASTTNKYDTILAHWKIQVDCVLIFLCSVFTPTNESVDLLLLQFLLLRPNSRFSLSLSLYLSHSLSLALSIYLFISLSLCLSRPYYRSVPFILLFFVSLFFSLSHDRALPSLFHSSQASIRRIAVRSFISMYTLRESVSTHF